MRYIKNIYFIYLDIIKILNFYKLKVKLKLCNIKVENLNVEVRRGNFFKLLIFGNLFYILLLLYLILVMLF